MSTSPSDRAGSSDSRPTAARPDGLSARAVVVPPPSLSQPPAPAPRTDPLHELSEAQLLRWAESTRRVPVEPPAPAAVPVPVPARASSAAPLLPLGTASLDDLAPPRPRGSLVMAIGVAFAAVVVIAGIAIVTRVGGGEAGDGEASPPSISRDIAAGIDPVDEIPSPSRVAAPASSSSPSTSSTAGARLTTAPGPTLSPSLSPTLPAAPPSPPSTSNSSASLAPVGEIPPHFGVYSKGKLYLQGAVVDRATADALVAKAAAVVGAGNVVDEYVIDPRAPRTSDARVIADEAVLFESGSTRIGPEFAEVIDLAVVAMKLNPHARLLIEGHTDSLGTERSNLRLSQRRADSIVRSMVGQGTDPSRLTAVGRGESAPVASNDTPEGMAQNRRIEVTFLGLLD